MSEDIYAEVQDIIRRATVETTRRDDGGQDVYIHGVTDAVVALIERERSSRQAWAEEAMRLQLILESRLCTGDHACLAQVHVPGCYYSDTESPEHPDYQGEVSRPQCAVHTQNGEGT
jgi:hypothetical protein